MGEFDGARYASYRELCAKLGLKRCPTLSELLAKIEAKGCRTVLLVSMEEVPWYTVVPDPEIVGNGRLTGRWKDEEMVFGGPTREEAACLAWMKMDGRLAK